MSDPKEQQPEPDELELESEEIADLDVDEKEADHLRGGGCFGGGAQSHIQG